MNEEIFLLDANVFLTPSKQYYKFLNVNVF